MSEEYWLADSEARVLGPIGLEVITTLHARGKLLDVRAVSRDGAGIYANRLFKLPPFLLDVRAGAPGRDEVAAGLALTGHFLLERVLRPHGKDMPPARLRLDAIVVNP